MNYKEEYEKLRLEFYREVGHVQWLITWLNATKHEVERTESQKNQMATQIAKLKERYRVAVARIREIEATKKVTTIYKPYVLGSKKKVTRKTTKRKPKSKIKKPSSLRA